MATHTPTTTQGWQLREPGLLEPETDSLHWNPDLPLRGLGPTDVCVKLHAAALNFRDLASSDAAGEVIAIGDRVDRFRIGDKVLPFLYSSNFIGGNAPSLQARNTTIGGSVDGVFRQHGIFEQAGLVLMPSGLSYEEGAAVSTPFATAWNALMSGIQKLQVGDSVLVEGSGATSIAAVQLASAAGAVVISTTSTVEKGERLKQLGAKHIINYRDEPEWGDKAKSLVSGGVKFILNMVGDPNSYQQSLNALAAGGEIAVIGFIGAATAVHGAGPSLLETLTKPCTVRGIPTSNRLQLEEVCRAIENGGIKPCFDSTVFELKELKAAYAYLGAHKNFGKVTVKIP